jgi:chromosome segregation ATPase
MGTTSFFLIIALETLALCLFVLAVLAVKNRKLRRLVAKLQGRLHDVALQYKKTRQIPPPAPAPALESYNDKLDSQIELTRDYHYSLGTRQDIALDLDPDAPLPRRTAAIRHAFLIAEKEATANSDEANWDFLASRYRQILAFYDDYESDLNTAPTEEAAQLKEELTQAKRRINNLERFKGMYIELEERWDRCKDKANEHYIELKNIAEQSGQKESFQNLLDKYQASYADLGALIEQGFQESINSISEHPEEHLQEIRRLRGVAADQHKIITELQGQLASSGNSEEKTKVVAGLQTELQKQARFLQESETCIQLMEDELANNKQEMRLLAERLTQLPKLKNELKELNTTVTLHEQVIDSLKQENRRLAKKLKLTQEAPPEDNQEAKTLRKELNTLQAKYNDLEEKFLNLKLKE